MSGESPYHPLGEIAQKLTGLYWMVVLLAVVGIGSSLFQLELVHRIATYGAEVGEADMNDRRQQVIAWLQILVQLLACGVFLWWFWIAHRNLMSLVGNSHRLRYGTYWTVLGFAIPFLNLVRPHQVMGEVWRGSVSDALEESSSPSLVHWWWTLLLLAWLIGVFLSQSAEVVDTADHLRTHTVLLIISDAVGIAKYLVSMKLVQAITRWQECRYNSMEIC